MAELGLPAKLDSIESLEVGLPDVVWGRILEWQRAGGMSRICEKSKNVFEEASRAAQVHKEIVNMLEEEYKQDDQFRQAYGSRWICAPSNSITQNYKEEVAAIKKLMDQADCGNKTLQEELQKHEMLFLSLGASREDLSGNIPGPKELQSPEAVAARDNLAKNLAQLSTLINERDEAYKKYENDIDKTDLTLLMMSGKVSVKEACDNVLAEFKAKEEVVVENIRKQKDVTKAVKSADDAFNKSRDISGTEKDREAKIHNLNEIVTRYNKLCKNFGDGLRFYTDLKTVYLGPLKSSVGDYLTARATERQMLLEDLNGGAENGNAAAPPLSYQDQKE